MDETKQFRSLLKADYRLKIEIFHRAPGACQIGFFPHLYLPEFCGMAFQKKLTPGEALQKARHYCGYQERCHQEVKEKLYGFGLNRQEVEQLISQLIEEDYLNEERFAIQFAGGKFRMKSWGRNRIRNELKQRQVSEYCIKKALKEITEDAYRHALEKLADSRWNSLKGEPAPVRQKKTQDHLLYKGYEWEYIQDVLKPFKTKD